MIWEKNDWITCYCIKKFQVKDWWVAISIHLKWWICRIRQRRWLAYLRCGLAASWLAFQLNLSVFSGDQMRSLDDLWWLGRNVNSQSSVTRADGYRAWFTPGTHLALETAVVFQSHWAYLQRKCSYIVREKQKKKKKNLSLSFNSSIGAFKFDEYQLSNRINEMSIRKCIWS